MVGLRALSIYIKMDKLFIYMDSVLDGLSLS